MHVLVTLSRNSWNRGRCEVGSGANLKKQAIRKSDLVQIQKIRANSHHGDGEFCHSVLLQP